MKYDAVTIIAFWIGTALFGLVCFLDIVKRIRRDNSRRGKIHSVIDLPVLTVKVIVDNEEVIRTVEVIYPFSLLDRDVIPDEISLCRAIQEALVDTYYSEVSALTTVLEIVMEQVAFLRLKVVARSSSKELKASPEQVEELAEIHKRIRIRRKDSHGTADDIS
jgi:hypothetical protein